MKIKLLLLTALFYLILNQSGFSQTRDSIKGKVVSSISLKRPIGEIYIMEKGTTNGTMADSIGQFQLVTLKTKASIYHTSFGSISPNTRI